jgi:Helix-turn-helix
MSRRRPGSVPAHGDGLEIPAGAALAAGMSTAGTARTGDPTTGVPPDENVITYAVRAAVVKTRTGEPEATYWIELPVAPRSSAAVADPGSSSSRPRIRYRTSGCGWPLSNRDVAAVFRLRNGLQQRRIAAMTGQSQSQVREILSGHRVVSDDVLRRIGRGIRHAPPGLRLAYDPLTEAWLAGAR